MTAATHPCLRLALLAGLLAPACAPAATGPGADWILQAVARPAPSRTVFVELRESPMLKQPLRLQGEYLIAMDNQKCGGLNVTFSGVYRRDAKPRP